MRRIDPRQTKVCQTVYPWLGERGLNAEVDRERSHHRSAAVGCCTGCKLALGVSQEVVFREDAHSVFEDVCYASAARVGRGGPVATASESVGRQSNLRVMPSGKPRLKVASNVVI